MLRTIIIEDEPAAANLLSEMLKDIAPEVSVVEMCPDLPSGVKSIKRHAPDIVFLDIELPVYSGIQLLEFFNPEEINFQVIFTTAYNEYAMKAFEMSAVDYLLKPLQEEKLNAAIKKVYIGRPAAVMHQPCNGCDAQFFHAGQTPLCKRPVNFLALRRLMALP